MTNSHARDIFDTNVQCHTFVTMSIKHTGTLGNELGIYHQHGQFKSTSRWLPLRKYKGSSGNNLQMVVAFPKTLPAFPPQ